MAFLLIGCSEWDVALSLELAADLAVEHLLVGFDGQVHVGPLLQAHTTEERAGGVQRIRLGQHAFQLQGAQQLLLLRKSLRLESSPLNGSMGVVGRLGQGHAERPGIHRDLGDKPVTTIFRLHRRAAQRLAAAHQLVQTLHPA